MENGIYIFTQEQVCKICEGKRFGICDCCYWKQMPHLSRQDAINRMAKAIKENEGEGPKDLAEAALNALLGKE